MMDINAASNGDGDPRGENSLSLLRMRASTSSRPLPPVALIMFDGGEEAGRIVVELIARGAQVFGVSVDEVKDWLRGEATERPNDLESDRHVIRFEQLTIDLLERRATWAGRVLGLSERELDLLQTLAEQPGRAWSFGDLQERVWSNNYFGDRTLVRMAIRRLRQKLRTHDVPLHIEAVRGFGYRLTSQPAASLDTTSG